MNIKKFVSIFEKLYPKRFAESWDKTGLIVCPNENSEVNRVLITNDLTLNVAKIAIEKSINLILCYHPLIFRPLASVSVIGTWQERVIIQCIKNDISIYAFHSVADCVNCGMNDYVCDIFSISSKEPIRNLKLSDHFRYCIDANKIDSVISRNIFIENNDCYVTFDSKNKVEHIYSDKLKEDEFNIKQCVVDPPAIVCGSGRVVILQTPISLSSIVEYIKTFCDIKYLSFASNSNMDCKISKIAICVGAGGSLFSNLSSDLYITGELSHHQILELVQNNKHVILTNHTNIENPYLKKFPEIMTNRFRELGFNQVEFCVFCNDDPLSIL